MEKKLFSRILINLEEIINIQTPIMDEIRSSIQNMDNFALNKFNQYCGKLILDIKNGQTSSPIELLAEEELLIYLTVLYHRILRNLFSIKILLQSTHPSSKSFDSIEFSVGILLRCNLLDSKLLYQLTGPSGVRLNIVDSFKHIDKSLKIRQKDHSVDERVVGFFGRLLEGFRNSDLGSLPFTYLQNPAIINQLSVLKDDCNGLYEVYSKYDHFSLYEISPMHADKLGKINMMANAIAAQIPAINMCLVGLHIKDECDINDKITCMWEVVNDLQLTAEREREV